MSMLRLVITKGLWDPGMADRAKGQHSSSMVLLHLMHLEGSGTLACRL